LENFKTSTNEDKGTRTGKCRKWNVYATPHETRRTYITVLYTDDILLTVPIKIIFELIKSTKKIKIATDGEDIAIKGSLGFVFAEEDGTTLLTCFRKPSRNDSLSFQLEICAFLAAVRLVPLITQYYDDILPCS
jgi:hypothetical protein